MYKCEKCKQQSKSGETLFKIFKYNYLEKGFDITGEQKVCHPCYNKHKQKNETTNG